MTVVVTRSMLRQMVILIGATSAAARRNAARGRLEHDRERLTLAAAPLPPRVVGELPAAHKAGGSVVWGW
jgi:hypothetical protein